MTIARRELAALKSEKTIVLALLIQLFVAAFSSFLVVGLVSMYDPSSIEGQEIAVGVSGEAADDLVAAIEGVDGVAAIDYDDPSQADSAFQRGAVDASLVATRSEGGQLQVRATVPDEGVRSTVIVVQVREALQELERVERAEHADRLSFDPIALPPEGDASPYFGFTYTVLVPILLFLPVFISGSIAVDSISEERERGTLELLRTAPVTLTGIVDAKLLAAAGLAPAQAALWLALLRLNGIAVENVLPLLAVVTALAGAIVALGLAVALLSPDRRQGQLVYSVGVLAAFVVAGLLPEHPANTIAKLAIDSPTTTTWVLVGCYLLVGALLLVAIRELIGRIDAGRLDGR